MAPLLKAPTMLALRCQAFLFLPAGHEWGGSPELGFSALARDVPTCFRSVTECSWLVASVAAHSIAQLGFYAVMLLIAV